MKFRCFICLMLILFMAACTHDVINLGDDYIIYKQEANSYNAIGLDLGNGLIQGLIDGEIESYGQNAKYVVAKLRDNTFYYFEKSAVKTNVYPATAVKRYSNFAQFSELTKNLNLPLLVSDGL